MGTVKIACASSNEFNDRHNPAETWHLCWVSSEVGSTY